MSNANRSADILSQLVEARGIIDACIGALSRSAKGKVTHSSSKADTASQTSRSRKLDFSVNERNFIKTHAKGLSGPKKFVLMLAYLTKGKVGLDTPVSAVRSRWGKMTAQNLMGYDFNVKYPNEAKTQGWVDSKKNGVYHLREKWTEIFN